MILHKIQLPKNWAFIALVNLLIAALLGLILRYKLNYSLRSINYSNLLHAHSHFVFHAWAGLALIGSFVEFLLPREKREKKVYGWVFWLMTMASFGMLISFTIQGYGFYSILFSTIAQIVYYWFTIQFIKDGKKDIKNKTVRLFSFAALGTLFISTLGPYFLAYFSVKGSPTPLATRGALYIYLHFQYNGWFFFGIMSLLFDWLNGKNLVHKPSYLKWSAILFIVGVIPGASLSIIGYTSETWISISAYFSVITKIIAALLIFVSLFKVRRNLNQILTRPMKVLWGVSAFTFFAKTGMETFSLNPDLALVVFSLRPLVIGYLHLIFLLMFTLFLFAYFFDKNQLKYKNTRLLTIGLWGFVVFSTLSEIFLFLQAYSYYFSVRMPLLSKYIFFVTLGIVLSLSLFVSSQFKYLKQKKSNRDGQFAVRLS